MLLPSGILTHQNETCIWHFFSSFLPRNDFTARRLDEQQVLKSYLHTSAGVRNAIVAVSALDLSRHADYSSMTAACYKQAVSSLRRQLYLGTCIDDGTLWTALLLAIFELMSDATGKNFMLHFTKGLPALIRQRNFNCGEQNRPQTLLHMIQMLEVMRSAPFWSNKEPTLLGDQYWQRMTQHAAGESSETRRFTKLYHLMGDFLTFNNMAYAIVLATAPDAMTLEDRQQLTSTADEGRNLRYQLEIWYIGHAKCMDPQTPLSLLCSIYYVTLAISMSAIFNVPHFAYCKLSVPASSAPTLSAQVDKLCMLVRCTLRTTNLAGTLVLWPLRVAGTNSIRIDQAQQVLEMLREIRRRGFSVAQSFEDVLTQQWKRRSLF